MRRDNPIDDQTWKIVWQYFPLVKYIAKKKGLRDDTTAWHCGIDILLRCVRSHDQEKGHFFSYAMKALWKSLNDRETCEQFFPGYVHKPLSDTEAECETADSVLLLRAKLDSYDWSLLEFHFYYDLTYDQIGAIVGLSRTQVFRHVQRALDNARELLDG